MVLELGVIRMILISEIRLAIPAQAIILKLLTHVLLGQRLIPRRTMLRRSARFKTLLYGVAVSSGIDHVVHISMGIVSVHVIFIVSILLSGTGSLDLLELGEVDLAASGNAFLHISAGIVISAPKLVLAENVLRVRILRYVFGV